MTRQLTPGRFDAIVVGAGVIGLATAWRSAQRGLRVAVADPRPGSGASYASAGMLAPVSELTFTEEALLQISLDSLRRWPNFAAELEALTGLPTGYRGEGTLQVAYDNDDLAAIMEVAAFLQRLGLPAQRLTGRECRRLEPMLAPAVRGGVLAPGDSAVDPRRVVTALLAAVEQADVAVVRDRVTELVTQQGAQVVGVRLAGGLTLSAPRVVLAAGCWSAELAEPVPGVGVPVRPVKGQILRLRTPVPILTRVVRGLVRGCPVYLVQRLEGELVIGATQEEMGFDTTVTAGALWELLRDARALVPDITELELAEATAGLRPGTPDNAPLLGDSGLPGLILATGHHRSGVLLTPITAEVISRLLADGELPEIAKPFAAARFTEIPA